MKTQDFIVSILISLLLGFLLIVIKNFYFDGSINPRQFRYQTPQETKEQVKFLRDSFEMEYYKKMLDSTYIFDHSKIPQ